MREDALGILWLARMLMEKGWAVTLQSTIVMPYPGTRLYEEALENGWFRVDPKDYDRFDMREPVLNTVDMEPEEVRATGYISLKKKTREIYPLF